MWITSLLKRFKVTRERVRTLRRRTARRLIVESLEGRRVLTSGVPLEFFDSVAVPALPSGWFAPQSGGGSPWATVAGSNSQSAANHAFISNPATTSEGSLQSFVSFATPNSSIVSFANWYETEPNFDGGVLEISIPTINNGAYQDILVAGGSFLSGGYNSTLQGTSALSGRPAWSGNSGGYIATTVQLPPDLFNGSNSVSYSLNWRFASDGSVGGVGWRIDSINAIGPIAPIDLATLTPAQGSTIFGNDNDDESGKSVSIVGDVNGDG